jgi:hypothetical protein
VAESPGEATDNGELSDWTAVKVTALTVDMPIRNNQCPVRHWSPGPDPLRHKASRAVWAIAHNQDYVNST